MTKPPIWFLVNQETALIFGSYLADIPVTFQSKIGYVTARNAQMVARKAALSVLKVDVEGCGESGGI